MSDDLSNNKPNNKPEDDASASAIFAELMRQAAARQTPSDDEQQTSVPSDNEMDFSWALEPVAPEHPQTAPQQTEAPLPIPPQQEPPTVPESLQSDTLQNSEKLAEAMEHQRVQRVQRRQQRRRRKAVGALGGFFRTVFVLVISAGLGATILTWFTDPQFLNPTVVRGLQDNSPMVVLDDTTAVPTIQPTQISTPNWLQRVGIVAGHRGPENDPGAVCESDGLTEAEITFDVAQRVVRNLRALNYSVDLLDEFDPRLENYQAAALISIHANTCQDFGEVVSGYLVAKAASRPDGGIDAILAQCVAVKYEDIVPLERRFTLTLDMTDYHTFREIHPLTPAAILELGFMLADRELLTGQPDLLALAITNGVQCFLGPTENHPVLTPIGNTIPDNFVPVESETPLPNP